MKHDEDEDMCLGCFVVSGSKATPNHGHNFVGALNLWRVQ